MLHHCMAVYDNSPLPWMKTKRVILHRNDSSAVQHCQLSTELRKLVYHSLVITLTEGIQARVGPSASGTQAVSWDLARRWATRFVDGYRRFRGTSCVYIVSWKWKEYVFLKLDNHPQDCVMSQLKPPHCARCADTRNVVPIYFAFCIRAKSNKTPSCKCWVVACSSEIVS